MAKSLIIVVIFSSIQFLTIVNTKATDENVNKTVSSNLMQSQDCVYNLCKSSNDYNEHLLKEIVSNKKYQQYLQLFGDVVDIPNANVTIENRFGDKIEGKSNMCSTKRITMYPKKGFTVDSKEKKIVNVPGYYQKVTFEACIDGAECYAGKKYLPIDVTSSCETQFIIVRLLVVHDDNALGLEQFLIPSGCSCMYSRV